MPLITEKTGDIFSAPANSVLIHACNTRGHWGRGVAAAFKRFSPAAYAHQHRHCTKPPSPSTSLAAHQRSLVGTCLLIPPCADAPKRFWIACLFTSQGYGKKGVDAPDMILEATGKVVRDLGAQVEAYRTGEGKMGEMGGCWSVRINSGLFGVEWQRTRSVLEGGGVEMVVVRPEVEDDGGNEKAAVGVVGKNVGAGRGKRKERDEVRDEGGGKKQTRLKFGKGN
ncbi:MAG: hypothetical protein LQ344_007226 [Seirophora lacunosa]|nr:MAG: hypothetical protein LQ344_007226 [Seirophora lacunosa]